MNTSSYLSVSRSVAVRAGVVSQRYMTKDGRYVVSDRDLRGLRLEPQEYVTGIDAFLLTQPEAQAAIREGGFNLGGKRDASVVEPDVEEGAVAEVSEETDVEPTGEEE